jgi:hypothetical protein
MSRDADRGEGEAGHADVSFATSMAAALVSASSQWPLQPFLLVFREVTIYSASLSSCCHETVKGVPLG